MIPYALPFRKPYVTARGSLDRREMVLLRIRTGDGVTGLGEGVPMSLRGGTALGDVVREIKDWGERAISTGETTVPDSTSAPARMAILIALTDVEARVNGVPAHRLSNPDATPLTVACNATLTTDTPAGVLAQAEEWAADGFKVFKLKLGSADDIGQVRAVRGGLGDDVAIRIDANGTWSLEEATRILGELEPLGIELAEQPVATLEEMAELRSRTSIPLVADESVSTPEEAALAASLSACDAVTVKLSKTGSLDARLGDSLPTYLSSALDGPVGIAAAAHAAQALPRYGPWSTVSHGLATERLFSATICEQGPLLDGPLLPVPSGNGLGITIDEPSLEAYRL
ncbi:MAG: mandelate racemase/muconate lactonizing enzyme family protein [Solirubrobacterales bacterium]|nr:mandelate racemase/muconate lactonizing enzyme family protein [Solirubrobacterales bacterium]